MFSDFTLFPNEERSTPAEQNERAFWLPPADARLLAFLPTRWRFPLIGPTLSASLQPIETARGAADGVIGWGDKPLARIARRYAHIRKLPYWTLEDGFLRSVGLGKAGAPSVSLIADDLGIHFSAHAPSRLELLLQDGTPGADLARAGKLREWIVHERLSKYNHLPEGNITLRPTRRKRILLVDQVVGDRSVAGSGANAETFLRMWRTARAESDADIIIKSHPDVVAGRAKGYLTSHARESRVQFIDSVVSPHSALDMVDEVWTVSSQLGLDALLRGMTVVTFGMPAYAGWGLTQDRADSTIARAARARRTHRVGLDELAHAMLLQYSLYVDPVTRQPTTAEHAIERLLEWRHQASSLSGRYLCLNFSLHKRSVLRRYLTSPSSQVQFTNRPTVAQIQRADKIVLWGNSAQPEETTLWKQGGRRTILRVEDGFIRSAGLGTSLVPPSSLCFDSEGIYFDASKPSRLETILTSTEFDGALLERAKRLRQAIVSMGITKYNLPAPPSPDYRGQAEGRAIVLVAGQVPNDASLRLGMASHDSDLELLSAVRRTRADAFIVYKQHPDLLAEPYLHPTRIRPPHDIADLVVGNVDLNELLHAADEVHVATSQIGFEALLRERPVWCYGLPFYAGWGLTVDAVVSLRRKRTLSLDALVAGALILYPRYWSNIADLPCEVEDVVAELYRARQGAAPDPSKRRWLAHMIHMSGIRRLR